MLIDVIFSEKAVGKEYLGFCSGFGGMEASVEQDEGKDKKKGRFRFHTVYLFNCIYFSLQIFDGRFYHSVSFFFCLITLQRYNLVGKNAIILVYTC